MLLIQVPESQILEILDSDHPISFVPADNREHAQEIGISARNSGFGLAVIENRSGRLLVLVVGDAKQESGLRHFLRRFGAEIAMGRHIEMGKAFVPASWLPGLAASQGADVGKL